MVSELRHPRRPEAASQYLLDKWGIRRTPATLAKQRHEGTGPRFRRAGRDIIYDEAALDEYAAGRISAIDFQSTAEAEAAA